MSIEQQIASAVADRLTPLIQELREQRGYIETLNEDEVLDLLGINKSTLAGLIESGLINPVGNGKRQRKRLFNKAEILDRKRSWGK